MKSFRLAASSLAVIALTLGAITGVGVSPASAATVTVTINDISFAVDNTAVSAGATVTDYSGSGGDVAIPASVTIGGTNYDVKTIGQCAFCRAAQARWLVTISIPASVTTIEKYAFYSLGLTSVTVPASVRTIGDYAFTYNQLRSLTIPASVRTIGDYAFTGNGLRSLTMLNGVTSIGDEAFHDNMLGSVEIPSSVMSIGANAFRDNAMQSLTILSTTAAIGARAFYGNSLATVEIPTGVTAIGEGAFGSNRLRTVVISEGVASIGAEAFADNELESVLIPSSVTSIGRYAFHRNWLTSVSIPSSVTSIGSYAFYGNRLRSVTIPGSVTTLTEGAFADNRLTSLTILDGVVSISDWAFAYNELSSLTIPASVSAIAGDAFYGTHNNIDSVFFLGGPPATTDFWLGRISGATVYYQSDYAAGFTSPWRGYPTALAEFTTAIPIISGTAQVGNTLRALAGSWSPSPTSVTYSWKRSGSDTVIGTGTFYQPSEADLGATITVTALLERAGFPAVSRTSIATAAVARADVTITINDLTFTVDSTNVSAGATLTRYSGDLVDVTIPARVTVSGITYAVTTIGIEAFQTMKVKSVVIPSSVSTIRKSAFQSSGLSSVSLPEGVTTIGDNAFALNRLTSITIPASVTAIGAGAFVGNNLTSVDIGRGVKSIGAGAFTWNSVTSVIIPANVTSIGANIFNLNPLTSVLFLGEAPTVTPAGSAGSFGQGTGITLSYLGPFASGFATASWAGYYLALANFTVPTPTVTGTVQVGETLRAASGTWYPTPDSVTYTWTRGDSGTILGQGETFTPSAAELGVTLIVTATGLMPGGQSVSADSVPTATVARGVYTAMPTPTISGTIEVAETLTAQPGSWPQNTTFSYAWRHVGSDTILGTGAFYNPGLGDLAHKLTVTITAAPPGYSTAVATSLPTVTAVGPGTFRFRPTPTISGTIQVGRELAVNPGSWPFGTTLAYEWRQRYTSTIIGHESTYTPRGTDYGTNLTVTVIATPIGYQPVEVTSAPTSTAVAPGTFDATPTPTISGASKVGQTLTANRGTWPADTTFTYAWKWSGTGTVVGSGETYTPVVADLGKNLTVTVTASLPGYISTSLTSAATSTAVSVGVFSNPTTAISGTAQVGKPLQATTGAWATGATLVYSWKRSGLTTPISTVANYTPVAADIGKTLTVTVTASRAGFTTAVVPSSPTTAIVAGVFTDATAPTITGAARFGTKLTTTIGAWATGATATYAWKRSGSSTVIGTAASYTPVTADIGKTLSVTVKVTRAGFTTLTTAAAVTSTVVAAPFIASPVPTITGTKKVGSTLTAGTTGWNPSGSTVTFTYVWKRASTSDGVKTTISRATAKTYKVVAADKGMYLTVTVTAKKTGYATVTVTSADGGTLIPS